MSTHLNCATQPENADGGGRGRRFLKKMVEPAHDLTTSYLPLLAVIGMCLFVGKMAWDVRGYVAATDKRLTAIEAKLKDFKSTVIVQNKPFRRGHRGA